MKVLYSLLGGRALVDQTTNQVTMVDLIEQFIVPTLPVVVGGPHVIVVQYFDEIADNSDAVQRIDLRYPEGKLIEGVEMINIRRNNRLFRTLIQIVGIQVEEEGLHEFVIKFGTSDSLVQLGTIPFIVRKDSRLLERIQQQIDTSR